MNKFYCFTGVTNRMLKILLLLTAVLLTSSPLFAAEGATEAFSGADTAWMMMATALVMLMTPAGLALFYGGLTQRKSVLNTIGMSYTAYCVVTVTWIVAGYSIAFANNSNPIWGGLSKVLMYNVGINSLSGTIPEILYAAFQGTFAAIAVAIVSGAIIERVRYSTWLVFCVLWTLFCYSPIAHFIWGGGFLSEHGELDFAGGTVIHVNAGVAGLVLAFLIGKRRNFNPERYTPYSIKLTMLGAALLWFGWFGFNAGSALGANAQAANAVMVTNVAAASGGMVWLLIEWLRRKPRSLIGTASGVVSGLVGITPAAGYVGAAEALAIGALSGAVGYIGVIEVKRLFGYDDSLDAFGIHGIVGIFGALATGIFANEAIGGATGVIYGNVAQIVPQLIMTAAVIVYCSVATIITYKVSTWITGGSRVSEVAEAAGMDLAYHSERDFQSHGEEAEEKEL